MSNIVNICDVCSEIFAGGDAPRNNMSKEKTEEYSIPIYSNGEANDGLYGFTNFARVSEPSITVSARGTIGYAAIRTSPFVPVVRLITLVPKQDLIDIKYLYYAIKNYKFGGSGTSIPQLTVPELKKYCFPLHALEKQQQIVSVLDKVSDLINKRKEQLNKLDELVKARFIEMFGDPILNQKGFPVYRMDEVVEFQGGSQPDKKYFEYEPTEDNIRLIQIRDYKTDKYITYIPKSMAKRFCSSDDIMIGRYGPPIFQILQGIEGSFNVALMKATPKMGNKEFIRQFLKQDCLLEYLEGLSKRTAGQDGIQMDKLKEYPFPMPPIELQEDFEKFIKQVDKSKFAVQKALDEAQTLFDSLMQEYFG